MKDQTDLPQEVYAIQDVDRVERGQNGLGVSSVDDPMFTLQAASQHGVAVVEPISFHPTQTPIYQTDGVTHALTSGNPQGCATVAVAFQLAGDRANPTVSTNEDVAFCLPANPMSDRQQAVAIMTARESGQGYWMEDTLSGPLRAEGENRPSRPSHIVAFQSSQSGVRLSEVHATLDSNNGSRRHNGVLVEEPVGPMAATFDRANITSPTNASRVEYGRPSHTLHSEPPCVVIQENPVCATGQQTHTLTTTTEKGVTEDGTGRGCPITFQETEGLDRYNQSSTGPITHPLRAGTGNVGDEVPAAYSASMRVRRLTPTECERLQGFPDEWTGSGVTPEGVTKEQADGPRYKQLGNAVTVNVAEWIGRRMYGALKIAAKDSE